MPALHIEAAWAEERLVGDLQQSVPQNGRVHLHIGDSTPLTGSPRNAPERVTRAGVGGEVPGCGGGADPTPNMRGARGIILDSRVLENSPSQRD